MDNYTFNYNEYKKKIKQQHGFSFLIILFLIIALVGIAYWLISNNGQNEYLYFVEVNSYLSYNEANIKAGEIQTQNGAGYIYFDNVYHVLAGYYPTEESATAVVNNILPSEPNSKVFKLECNSFNRRNNLTNKQNELVIEIVNKNKTNLNKIYENIINFDKNEANINELNINFLNLKTDYENLISEFSKNFNQKSKYINAIDSVKKIKTSIENLITSLSNNEFYKLKYETINIAIQHQCFLSCF